MPILYELAVLGAPSAAQTNELITIVEQMLGPSGLRLGHEVNLVVCPSAFCPSQRHASAAVFYGGASASTANIDYLLAQSVPVIPVTSSLDRVKREIPESLQPLNCLDYGRDGANRVATALLENVGLLPRQRRVFVSYKRDEAREVALQLFEVLSSRSFDVFLDTHKIDVAEDFQAVLWHHLYDSDVLVMLDTPAYFKSRWTTEEFGRALSKGISVLRIGWPSVKRADGTELANQIELLQGEIDPKSGKLSDEVIRRMCSKLETARVESHTVRKLNLVSKVRQAVSQINGKIIGYGARNSLKVRLADGRDILVYPTVEVPKSTTLHHAAEFSGHQSAAVVYDHIGLHPRWVEHLDWLGTYVRFPNVIKCSEADQLLATVGAADA